MFGRLLPDHWNALIAIHFAHRAGAVVVSLAVIATSAHVWYHHRRRPELSRLALIIPALVAVQITLGGLTVLTGRDVWINSLHVVCGALVLTTSLVLTLRTWRVKFGGVTVRLKPDTTTDTRDASVTSVTTNTTPDAAPSVRRVRLQPDPSRGARS